MDKTINGITYTKARFLRTTCKQCRKDLSNAVINNEGKFCNKLCRRKWISKPKNENKIDELKPCPCCRKQRCSCESDFIEQYDNNYAHDQDGNYTGGEYRN